MKYKFKFTKIVLVIFLPALFSMSYASGRFQAGKNELFKKPAQTGQNVTGHTKNIADNVSGVFLQSYAEIRKFTQKNVLTYINLACLLLHRIKN